MIALRELKKHLRIPDDETAEDAYLVDLEAAALGHIEDYTGRYFGPVQVVTEQMYDGYDADVIWLRDTPTAGETVTVEAWDGSAWAATTDDFEVDGFALYNRTSYWVAGRRNIRVTYSRGYAPGDEPWPIRQAVLEQVAEWYTNREASEAQGLASSVRALAGSRMRRRV